MARYPLTILLGSWLLFQVQPLIGKYILPWFGGSPAVWTTCMLAYQAMLLAGYAYAHLLCRRLALRGQAIVHGVLLAGALCWLPIVPSQAWEPIGYELPTWRILGLLVATIGGPYVLLASTSPLLQSWLAQTHPERNPYRLYALSNAGSLLALLSYPLLVEPMLQLDRQCWIWSIAFVVFAVLCGMCAWSASWRAMACGCAGQAAEVDRSGRGQANPLQGPRPGWLTVLLWLAWAANGSVLLLASTNQMCQEVAVVPFLWVLPLVVYLGTFILCFDNPRWYRQGWYAVLLVFALAAALGVLLVGVAAPLWLQISIYLLVLFVCCMVCHGELVRLKPNPRYLTAFYLAVAAGGALGGAFTTLLAPRLFPGYWEYHLGLVSCAALLLVTFYRDRQGLLASGRPRWAWCLILLAFAGVVANLGIQVWEDSRDVLVRVRNFYGILSVARRSDQQQRVRLSLRHGRITHGFQFADEKRRRWPTSYYGPQTGAGLALRLHPRRLAADRSHKVRIGVVGLGVGTLAAYAESGDLIRFYEINPDVIRLAEQCFSYCRDCRGTVEIVLGDARVSLQRELRQGRPGRFDVLVVDAFNSDAIPVHLLTRECFQIYWDHLQHDGILAVHISNRYLDLRPLVRHLAIASGKQAVLIQTPADEQQGVDGATWVLVTGNRQFLGCSAVGRAATPWSDTKPLPGLWTDRFSNLLEVLGCICPTPWGA